MKPQYLRTPCGPLIAGCLAAAVTLMSIGVSAAEDKKAGLDAHEHDHGTMNIVVDQGALEIELMLPGVNVVGFEHEAETSEQKKTVEDSISMLERTDVLFQPSEEAECKAEDSTVEQHIEEGHMAFESTYRFTCAKEEQLEKLSLNLFENLREIEEIDVQLVTPTIQTQIELTADDEYISLMK